MKNLKFTKLKVAGLMLAALGIATFSACKKDRLPQQMQNDKTILDIVAGDSNFSLLKAAVIHADLAATLSSKGPFTVFAPDNAAFIAAGLSTADKINALPAQAVKDILLYHVLGQAVPAAAIQTASNTAITTAGGKDVFVTKNNSGVYVNGAMVTKADIMASNGVIHVINTVLMPPTGNIVDVAKANPNLSYLVAAVVRASSGTTNVANVLSGAGPFTVFAPTNQAFIDAGFATVAAINAADPNVLAGILTYHVIGARVLSSDLTEGAMPVTLNGAKVTITLAGGAKVKGNMNATAATISPANIITTNGVVHVINQVLLP